MRKILIVLGIVMMAAGCVVVVLGANATMSQLAPMAENMTKPEELCQSGEKLITPEFSTRPQAPQAGLTGFFYCVDDGGNRRDVTQEYFSGTFDQMFTVLPGWATAGFTGIALFCLGLPLLILGAVLSLRGQNRPATITIPVPTNAPPADLSERLRQLDEAYEKGLISQEKYDEVRNQILDQMV
ncbi:MAG: SHOCT domain-containing protein [Anaerolineae bacterium]